MRPLPTLTNSFFYKLKRAFCPSRNRFCEKPLACVPRPNLKTPDALHAATALQAGCALFVTNDVGFRQVASLPLVVLDDLLIP